MKLCEVTTPRYLYHATFSKNVSRIAKEGLIQFETSNWSKGEGGTRYNEEAGLFAFEHPEDAMKWALKMDWEFKTPISIVRINVGDMWEQDPSEDINLQFGKGKSLRSRRNVPASEIIDEFPIKPFGNPSSRNMNQKEWFEDISRKLRS